MSKKKDKPILYIDMDNVLADFSGSRALHHWQEKASCPSAMYGKNFFRDLEPLPGAIEAVMELIASDKYDIYVLSQPVAKSPHSYSEKVTWVLQYLPDLMNKIILIQDKLMLRPGILVDDDKKWGKFEGEFIHFNRSRHPFSQWQDITENLLSRKEEEEK